MSVVVSLLRSRGGIGGFDFFRVSVPLEVALYPVLLWWWNPESSIMLAIILVFVMVALFSVL